MAEYYKRVVVEESKLLQHQYDAEDTPDVYICYEPAADVVEVVRCGQCKHWTGVVLGSRCNYHSFPPNSFVYKQEHDFCSKGERRESDE